MLGTTPDLLRLLVVPAFGWAAWRDVRTRRVPNGVWYPLVAVGVVALAWDLLTRLPLSGVDDRLFLLRVGLSLGFLVPFGYLLWRIGGFGGADAKALMVLAVVFPAYPVYYLPWDAVPLVPTTLGVFSMTVLTNTVLVGLAYPLVLGVRNALGREFSPVMFVGRRVDVPSLATEHGRLFETRAGFTRHGLDVDALRMYLRWRGTTLADLRAHPDAHRDPAGIGETHAPGDGAVDDGPPVGESAVDGGAVPEAGRAVDAPNDGAVDDPSGYDDPWGAERFLDEIEGSAYGTTPEKLREGLELVASRDAVWLSPGIPFLVPMFGGLLVALTYGDVFFALLRAAGVA
ncbi:prepilin peptidase [Salinirarus marinus]|uniref:A24 family peptidase n=1 Tax=Salinirarus marinus TaxID=3068310 RepID=UPI003C6C8786